MIQLHLCIHIRKASFEFCFQCQSCPFMLNNAQAARNWGVQQVVCGWVLQLCWLWNCALQVCYQIRFWMRVASFLWRSSWSHKSLRKCFLIQSSGKHIVISVLAARCFWQWTWSLTMSFEIWWFCFSLILMEGEPR